MTKKDEEEKEEKEPSFADRLQKRAEDVAEAALVSKQFGVLPEAGGSKKDEDSLPATVVKAAMDSHEKAVERAEAAAKEHKADFKEAAAEAANAKERLAEVQIEQLKGMMIKMDDTMNKMRDGAAPKSINQVVKDAQELLDLVQSSSKPATAVAEPVDSKLALELEKMRQTHEIAMKNLDLQLAQISQDFQLKMAEFGDNKAMRIMEYQDNKAFREQGLEGFQDLVGSISAGITRERAGGSAKVTKKGKEEQTMEASITQFPCQFCESQITVNPGDTSVTCPNEDCGAEYEVKARK